MSGEFFRDFLDRRQPKADLNGLRQVRSELEVITKDLKIDLVQWAALKAVCEGHPAGMPNAAVLMGRKQRVAADAMVKTTREAGETDGYRTAN